MSRLIYYGTVVESVWHVMSSSRYTMVVRRKEVNAAVSSSLGIDVVFITSIVVGKQN